MLSSLARNSQEPWYMLGIFFVNVIFITLWKKSFSPKNFWISCTSSKVPFCQNWKIAKVALLNPCMEFKKKLAKRLLFKHYEDKYTKNIFNLFQGSPNPGFRSVRVENWDFLKKDSHDFKNSFQFGFLWIPNKTGGQN